MKAAVPEVADVAKIGVAFDGDAEKPDLEALATLDPSFAGKLKKLLNSAKI